MIPPRAAWRVKAPTVHPEDPRLDGLLEEGTDAIPVRVTIVQDEVTTGWDEGALGFEDGAVWFSGRATSFRLLAPDVLPGAYLLSRREPVTSGEALNQGFPVRHPTRKVWVRVRVLTEDEEGKARDEARLIEGVKRLRAGPLSLPEDRGEGSESEYPPLAPRPGLLGPLPKRRSPETNRRFRMAFAGCAVGCVVVDCLLSAIHRYPAIANLAGIMVFPCFLNSIVGPRDLTDSDLRTLRRIADEEAEPPSVRLTGWH